MQHWPSSPLQPSEFDMTLQIFQTEPKVREENLEGHVKFWGVAEDYLALETSQDQSHHAPKLI